MIIYITSLHGLGQNNLNRDDAGRPKTTTLNGTERLAPSSQWLKRHLRMAFDGRWSVRTREFPALLMGDFKPDGTDYLPRYIDVAAIAAQTGETEEEVRERLTNVIRLIERIGKEKVTSAQEKVHNPSEKKSKPARGKDKPVEPTEDSDGKANADEEDDKEEGGDKAVGQFLSREEILAYVDAIQAVLNTLPALTADDLCKIPSTKVISTGTKKAPNNNLLWEVRQDIRDRLVKARRCIDAMYHGMWGRMAANQLYPAQDAAMTVSTPYSAERVVISDNFFTAIDDVKDDEAMHMGAIATATPCNLLTEFYLDLKVLAKNTDWGNIKDLCRDPDGRTHLQAMLLDVFSVIVKNPVNIRVQGNRANHTQDMRPYFTHIVVGTDGAPERVNPYDDAVPAKTSDMRGECVRRLTACHNHARRVGRVRYLPRTATLDARRVPSESQTVGAEGKTLYQSFEADVKALIDAIVTECAQ